MKIAQPAVVWGSMRKARQTGAGPRLWAAGNLFVRFFSGAKDRAADRGEYLAGGRSPAGPGPATGERSLAGGGRSPAGPGPAAGERSLAGGEQDTGPETASGARRGVNGLLFTGSFFFSLSSNILSFSLVYLLTDRFGFNPGQVGTCLALGSLCYFLGCNLYHRFGTTASPPRTIAAAVTLVFACSIVLGHSRNSLLAALAYALVQGGTGFFWPPVMAWFTRGLDSAALNRNIAVFNRSWMSGNLLGPPISGALYHVSSGLSFTAANLGYALVLGVLAVIIRRGQREPLVRAVDGEGVWGGGARRGGPAPETGRQRTGPGPKAAVPLASPVALAREKAMDWFRYRGWIGAVCTSCFVGVLGNIVPLHIRDGLGYTERAAGMVLFIRCASALIGFTVLARIDAWHFNRRWFLLVQSVLALCAFAFLPAGDRIAGYFGIILVYGFVHSCCYNNSIFHSSATGRNTGKNLALHEVFLSVGNGIGSAGGGFCYQRFGFAGTFTALGIVQVLGLALFVALEYRDRGR
jgi:predicted MFS family arabinose efflux permease